MRLLLDTHTLLWFYGGDESLPEHLKEVIQKATNECYVSIASLWEITIKVNLRKLDIGTSLPEFFSFLERNQFWVIPVELTHLLQLQQLPNHHKDPFDRLIISQALAENLTIATKDSIFSQYSLTTTW
ncbi:type II toxin-antitoxin system VapC family toxin [Spirosoma koreense]